MTRVGPVKACAVAVVVATMAVALGRCAHGRDDLSGPDALRINAAALALDTVADDTVDAESADATDWRYIDLEKPGRLTAQLHWDNATSRLTLGLYDAL